VPNSQDAFPNDPNEWADANGNGIGDNADAAAARANHAPDAPVLVSPVNGETVSRMPVLQTGAFHDPVAGSTHATTRWQVFRDDDDVCVLDVLSATALTRLPVPKLVLEEGTEYFWRAQFTDSVSNISEWPADGYFITEETGTDLNADGILDVQEVASTVDLDRDGVKDNKQPQYIKSVKMEGTNIQIGVSIKGCPTCIAVESVESEDARQPDSVAYGKPASMPFGLINFKIAVANPGDQAIVKLYFSKAASRSSKWYKYDPIADLWYDFSAYAKFGSDRRSVTLTLTDGGPEDADGVANGVIVDPAGVAEADAEIVRIGGSGRNGRGGGFMRPQEKPPVH
jgi:chitinase